MADRDPDISDGARTFQRWIAVSWFVLAGAFGLIAARALFGGYTSWWAWGLVASLCVGVGLLHWHAHRVWRWMSRLRR
jgi:membrane protein YdbS with pleckstrin-like domain